MNHVFISLLAVAILVGDCFAAEKTVVSTPQVGDPAVEFLVRDCTGPASGKRLCYMCRYGTRPIVAVFTRQIDAKTADLVKRIDNVVKEKRTARLAAFVVLIDADTATAESKLKALATKRKISETPLTIFNDKTSKLNLDYGLADDAPLTVMLWRRAKFHSSHVWDQAQPSPELLRKFASDLAEILE
ncbi:MAG: hypothetical protein VB875_06670 [Pirellulales bacterium]